MITRAVACLNRHVSGLLDRGKLLQRPQSSLALRRRGRQRTQTRAPPGPAMTTDQPTARQAGKAASEARAGTPACLSSPRSPRPPHAAPRGQRVPTAPEESPPHRGPRSPSNAGSERRTGCRFRGVTANDWSLARAMRPGLSRQSFRLPGCVGSGRAGVRRAALPARSPESLSFSRRSSRQRRRRRPGPAPPAIQPGGARACRHHHRCERVELSSVSCRSFGAHLG